MNSKRCVSLIPRSNDPYVPKKQDIVYIDFDPSAGREINKRRPAVVVSNQLYSQKTGFVAVCPITNGAKHLLDRGLLVPVDSKIVTGYVNPFRLHTFDYRKRNIQKADFMDTATFQKVVQLYRYIFDE